MPFFLVSCFFYNWIIERLAILYNNDYLLTILRQLFILSCYVECCRTKFCCIYQHNDNKVSILFDSVLPSYANRPKTKRVVPGLKKLMLQCLKKASSLMAIGGQLHWLQEEVRLNRSLGENGPTSHMIYYLSEHFSLNH